MLPDCSSIGKVAPRAVGVMLPTSIPKRLGSGFFGRERALEIDPYSGAILGARTRPAPESLPSRARIRSGIGGRALACNPGTCLLDEHDLKMYVDSVVAVPADADLLKKYKAEMAKTKQLIHDGVRDHVVCHIVDKGTTKEM